MSLPDPVRTSRTPGDVIGPHTEEWFRRLHAPILNIIEIGLLLFAGYEIVTTRRGLRRHRAR